MTASTKQDAPSGEAVANAPVGRPRQSRHDAVTAVLPGWLRVVVLTLLVAAVTIPVGYILVASFMPDVDVANGQIVPDEITTQNYVRMWSTVDLAGGLANSLVVSGIVAIISAMIATITAYCLVRFAFRGRLTILRGLVALQSLPGTLLLLPIFVLFSSARTYLDITIIGTRFGLIVTYLTFALPFSTWVMVTYLRGLPRELEEAAMLDGCSPIGVLRRVVVPLSWPGIVVAAVFAFLLGWNDVLFASVMTRPETETVAVALQVFGLSQEGGAIPLYGQLMSSALVCALPVVVLYMIFQRYLVGGLTAGGVK
ncbi:carbohydrate ABC transporter permease [Pseudonocardia sp. TRM90224]|uniref:carbohydrate ABC transporter permease n=1 Tax=Pseudonocardia sp. TRM90224 TaxID=2812678 RepID=UPI001E60E079|nr:carbohydrate ABC transporter permease [Pseudonocardia sp. TRM90224]